MLYMKELQHITIRVAHHSFDLDIPRGQEESVRAAERNLNKLWAKWCGDFHDQQPQTVLAMVAFQYARYYYNLAESVEANSAAIEQFEKHLDKILLGME